jgi:teichoic acid transport system ATP-binding protein
LRAQAGTVFLVSHGLGIIRQTCTRALWLENGRIVIDGDANTVVDAYQKRYDPDADNRVTSDFDTDPGVDNVAYDDEPSSL